MEKNKKVLLGTLIATLVFALIFAGIVIYLYYNNEGFKMLFTGTTPEDTGLTIGGDSPDSQAAAEFTGKVSMWIFIFITLLQLAALWIGFAVISSIRNSSDPVKLKLRNLENAEVFFDVPLYFGLFGTVSAFLVMTFSPQSSRLIAYSSTLIGIVFSLFLRLTMQYPLRKKLVRLDTLAIEEEKDAK